jgi:integrase
MPRRRRRAKGSGSVYKTQDGWCAQREAPRGPDGRRRYERRFFPTRLAALDQVSAWERERLARASHPRATDTTGDWLAYWLATKRGTVAASTLEYYTRHIGYTLPHIGPIPLYALEPGHIRDVLAAPSLLKPQSRKHVRTVLSMALQLAVNEGVIPRNPCATVEPPKVEKYRAYALSEAELQALFAAVAGARLEPFWHLMADYGMRLDELLSAKWLDYDPVAGKLHIRATKTGTERWLELTDDHQGRLAAWRDALAVEAEDAPRRREMGYLFPSEAGTKLLASNARRAFKEALRRAGLPRSIRIHDLRHTAATNLIAAGNDIPTVQYITGHRDSKVLLEIYAHYQQGRDREAIERVEAKRRKKS